MPYYVYKIMPMRLLEKVEQFDKFKEASAFAKSMRAKLTPQDNFTIKVIFGENELQAEDALNQVREPEPMTGEDY